MRSWFRAFKNKGEASPALVEVFGLVVEPGSRNGGPGSDFQMVASACRNLWRVRCVQRRNSSVMNTPSNEIRVRIDQIERLLMFDYEPGTREALFDICDRQGHIVKTGEVKGPETRVRITDLEGDEYYLMVLDGEISTVKPFQLRKVG